VLGALRGWGGGVSAFLFAQVGLQFDAEVALLAHLYRDSSALECSRGLCCLSWLCDAYVYPCGFVSCVTRTNLVASDRGSFPVLFCYGCLLPFSMITCRHREPFGFGSCYIHH